MKEFLKRHPGLWMQLWWIFYIVFFAAVERWITVPRYWVRCRLDDYIPFCEGFVFLYGAWFVYLVGSIALCWLTSAPDYSRLCKVLFTGMTLCLILYVLFPNGQQLRPETLPDNLAGWLMTIVYAADSPCNVCPSIHCFSSVAIHLVLRRHPLFAKKRGLRWSSGLLAAGICLSTVFVKQHSCVDVLLGAALCLPLMLVFKRQQEAVPVRDWLAGQRARRADGR